MTHLTKVLDTLTGICVVLLSKYFVAYANMVFDWKLRWYLLENIP
ncbi:epilancin biosynthesis-related protein ElxI1, partial [Staphylococcus aureus]